MRIGGWIILATASLLFSKEPITPIPQTVPYNKAKAALGEKLFADPILSRDKTVSCLSCHSFSHGGTDGKAVSTGIGNQKGHMNAPTILNATFNFAQFWNGRAVDLHEQALGPIHNPIEMGLTGTQASQRINNHPYYRKAFEKLYGDSPVTISKIADVIAEYEKSLITPNSKFDRYLEHKATLTPSERNGYQLFKTLGCITCHNGINIGGNTFQKMGAVIPVQRKEHIDDRYAITKREMDKNVFKVPTLRNIALTAPYFHDGSAKTLKEAIGTMSFHNLGIQLTPAEINDIVAFLSTLTGELPKNDTAR